MSYINSLPETVSAPHNDIEHIENREPEPPFSDCAGGKGSDNQYRR